MSTKAIREALARLEILMEEPPAGMSVEDAVLLNSARTEVEAIERAARTVSDHGIYWGGCETGGVRDECPEMDAAEAVFDAITNQDP